MIVTKLRLKMSVTFGYVVIYFRYLHGRKCNIITRNMSIRYVARRDTYCH